MTGRLANMQSAALAVALMTMAPLVAQAHHAYRSVYDFNRTDTLVGEVVRLELVNPHARLFINVTNENGDVVEWMIEGTGQTLVGAPRLDR